MANTRRAAALLKTRYLPTILGLEHPTLPDRPPLVRDALAPFQRRGRGARISIRALCFD
ncbi:hypothetical protein SPHINGOAX6_70486 [Sphingomonas sp. AX6]|nr:hypothetical protein SPHINGOAX6_70486 [Sphingomonas sp. AX6]